MPQGLWFEDFEVGAVFDHALTRTVTETDNILFSSMTLNPAKLHLDAHHCATERTSVLDKRGSKSRPEAGIVTFRHEAFKQTGELVATCDRQAFMLRKKAT